MTGPVRTVLCPVDFSAASEEAARFAVSLAEALGARLELLHVYQPPTIGLPAGASDAAPSDEPLRANARRQLEQLGRRYSQRGLTVGHHVLVAHPTAEAILAHVGEVSADLVVMSTRGRSGLEGLLIGSVAEKIVRRCPVPVCTVRATD